MIRFCYYCGEGYNRLNDTDNFECSECQAIFRVPQIIKETQISLEEAQAAFNKIPLTDKKAIFAAKRKKKGIVPNSKSD